jgi:hypothetical protein
MTIQYILVLLPPFEPIHILAMNEGGDIQREKFTYKLHDLWNLMVIREGIKEGWYDKGAL